MKRIAIPLALALIVGAVLVPAASPSAAATAGSESGSCVYKWKKKRVIKKVHRNGKVKKVVRYKWRRVCVHVTPPAPARLGVKAYEFGFTLSRQTLSAGDTIVELSNRGEDPHNLHIQKVGGGPEIAIPDTAPSTYERVRLETKPGTYRLWCSLPTHAELGMDTTFEAAAG